MASMDALYADSWRLSSRWIAASPVSVSRPRAMADWLVMTMTG